MKKTLQTLLAVLLLAINVGCKKNISVANGQVVTAADNNNVIKSVGTLGRQQIIYLPTGDHTYPTSQALLWSPHPYLENKNINKKFPLIINLYGQGQCGTDLNLMFQDNTMSSYIANGFDATAINPVNNKTYSFFVCSPQCPTSWGWSASQVNVMLATLTTKLPIDKSRIYITGFSSGGWGLWSCMTDNDKLTRQFAAIVPISSAAADHPDKITNVDEYGIACLNICGDQDAFYQNAVDYTNIINSNNPPVPAILNTLKGVGHSAWVQAYNPNWKQTNGLNIYEWMLQYTSKN
jgi:predicted peptidase